MDGAEPSGFCTVCNTGCKDRAAATPSCHACEQAWESHQISVLARRISIGNPLPGEPANLNVWPIVLGACAVVGMLSLLSPETLNGYVLTPVGFLLLCFFLYERFLAKPQNLHFTPEAMSFDGMRFRKWTPDDSVTFTPTKHPGGLLQFRLFPSTLADGQPCGAVFRNYYVRDIEGMTNLASQATAWIDELKPDPPAATVDVFAADLCPKCFYSRTGLPDQRHACPECGWTPKAGEIVIVGGRTSAGFEALANPLVMAAAVLAAVLFIADNALHAGSLADAASAPLAVVGFVTYWYWRRSKLHSIICTAFGFSTDGKRFGKWTTSDTVSLRRLRHQSECLVEFHFNATLLDNGKYRNPFTHGIRLPFHPNLASKLTQIDLWMRGGAKSRQDAYASESEQNR